MMNTHPLNLAVRFLLELVMLLVLSLWGWHLFSGWEKYASALAFPVIAAVLWGVFRIQNDPKPAPVEIPGMLRLLLELLLFGLAAWGLFDMGYTRLSYLLLLITGAHYIVSWDRTWAMLQNRPYTAFVK